MFSNDGDMLNKLKRVTKININIRNGLSVNIHPKLKANINSQTIW